MYATFVHYFISYVLQSTAQMPRLECTRPEIRPSRTRTRTTPNRSAHSRTFRPPAVAAAALEVRPNRPGRHRGRPRRHTGCVRQTSAAETVCDSCSGTGR